MHAIMHGGGLTKVKLSEACLVKRELRGLVLLRTSLHESTDHCRQVDSRRAFQANLHAMFLLTL